MPFYVPCFTLVLDIRLNTLTFMFLATSGTPNFEYVSLILLQLPPHLLVPKTKKYHTYTKTKKIQVHHY